MKSEIFFSEACGTAFLMFRNECAIMHHSFFAGSYSVQHPHNSEAQKQAALAQAKKLQPSVDEALSLNPPAGFVFAGIDELTQRGVVAAGFREPARRSKAEKATDARIGRPARLLYRLSTGLDATFVPVTSDWNGEFAAPRGAGARVTRPPYQHYLA
jgi:hypothetical protein